MSHANGGPPQQPGDGFPQSRLFGLDIETSPPADLLRRILAFAERGEHRRVSYVNAHVLNQSFTDDALRDALQRSDLVYCDGYGVRLATKAIGLPVPHRMTGADWIWGVAALCEAEGRSLYLLGSDAGASQEAAACLKRWYPRLEVRGAHHGYFQIGTPHSERVVEHINEHKPDVLLVGMGTPLQELWVDHYFDRLDANVVWTVGALFDYVSGRVQRAPHWMADHGLEWIFRLAIEPRRMWRRYLLGNPVFLWRVMSERHAHRDDPAVEAAAILSFSDGGSGGHAHTNGTRNGNGNGRAHGGGNGNGEHENGVIHTERPPGRSQTAGRRLPDA
ncbi:MAG: N-acetylglucosaminyldiphosphoundecaprenol N-acetyl-beta-D-mannosaminyltransferase [Thermoleophilaceae bacterium]|nr:N-acetylglucosaminyldiphosphoundecaprenol N-acetyl-beta-D-mannosaminyltransferase [Thermoleophilaceae bacterium]